MLMSGQLQCPPPGADQSVAHTVISIFDCAALAFISSTISQGSKSTDCTLQTSRKLCQVNQVAVTLAGEKPAKAVGVNLPSWLWVCSSERSFQASVCVCVCCRFLGVPPGRGSCPLTGPLPFDLIYTDYHGLQQMKQHMGLSLKKHKLVGCTQNQRGWLCFLHAFLSLMRVLSAKIQLPKSSCQSPVLMG